MFLFRACLGLAICLLVALVATHGTPPLADRQQPPASSPRTDRHGDPLPEGAVARLGTTRFRPPDSGFDGNPISFAFILSPDGEVVATGERGKVRFWEMATGKEVRSFTFPRARAVIGFEFSPDGKLFAAHTDDAECPSGQCHIHHTIYLGDVASGKVLHEFHKDYLGCREVTFSPDGNVLAAFRNGEPHDGPYKEVLILWDVHTGKELHQLEDARSAVFTPDSKKLVVGNNHGGIQVLDPGTGREVQRLEGHPTSVRHLAVSPDGRTLVSADEGQQRSRQEEERRTSVRLWDLATGKVRHQWTVPDETVSSLGFSPDGRTVAVTNRKSDLLLHDVASGEERQRFRCEREFGLSYAFSPDSKVLLLHDYGGPFREWDIARGEERRRWGGERCASILVYSPEGRLLVSSAGSGGLTVWDVAAGKERHAFPGHGSRLQALTFSPDGRLVASLDVGELFGLWETSTGKPLLPMRPEDPEKVLGYGFAADGAFVSAVSNDGTVRVWDLAGGLKVRRFRIATEETVRAWEDTRMRGPWPWDPDGSLRGTMVYSSDGKRLAVAEKEEVIVWDLATARRTVLRDHLGQFRALLFSDDGKLLVGRGEDGHIRVWEAGTGKELAHFPPDVGCDGVLFSPDSKVLAWTSYKKAVHLWDVAARKELHRFPLEGSGIGCVAFHRDGKLLAVAGSEMVRVWDLTTGKEWHRLEGGGYEASDAKLFRSPDGAALVSMVRDGVWEDVATRRRLNLDLTCWDQTTISPDGKTLVLGRETLMVVEMMSEETVGEMPLGHRGELAALAFAADGKLLATGGSDGTILVWDWRRASGLAPAPTAKVGARELERTWEDLGSKSGKTAYRAIGTLIAAGDEAAAWLGKRLQPVAERDREAVRRLIAVLDDNRFEERARASKELEQLGADAEPILRQALADKLPAEAARRVETLLAGPNIGRFSAQTLQKIRAVQALEQIGTARAREVLEKLAGGVPEARLTQEAGDAGARLSQRR
jgi:WD40 repeat protein